MGARPPPPCDAAGVAFLLKQNGEFASVSAKQKALGYFTFPDGATVRRVGKKSALRRARTGAPVGHRDLRMLNDYTPRNDIKKKKKLK